MLDYNIFSDKPIPMILLVDSGSTKTDWVCIMPDETETHFRSKGLNPSTQTELDADNLESELRNCITNANIIWYYGAGVANKRATNKVHEFLKKAGATGKINIDGDLVGAGRAICGQKPGIIGILGTGSNAGVYENGAIIYQKSSLGYILGDEGGGVHIGKEVLKSYFYGTLPKILMDDFYNKYALEKDTLLSHVYTEMRGSQYIASYANFLSGLEHPWKNDLLERVFKEFIELRLIPLLEKYNLSVSLIGSVAYEYRDILNRMMHTAGIETGQIVQKPMRGLVEYHKNLSKNV